jgi:hypothetical protein
MEFKFERKEKILPSHQPTIPFQHHCPFSSINRCIINDKKTYLSHWKWSKRKRKWKQKLFLKVNISQYILTMFRKECLSNIWKTLTWSYIWDKKVIEYMLLQHTHKNINNVLCSKITRCISRTKQGRKKIETVQSVTLSSNVNNLFPLPRTLREIINLP